MINLSKYARVSAFVALVGGLSLCSTFASAAPGKSADENGDRIAMERSQLMPVPQFNRGLAGPMQYVQNSENRRISISAAKAAAQRSRPGAAYVNAQLVDQGTYRVRLREKNGHIVDVYVDAYSGRVKN